MDASFCYAVDPFFWPFILLLNIVGIGEGTSADESSFNTRGDSKIWEREEEDYRNTSEELIGITLLTWRGLLSGRIDTVGIQQNSRSLDQEGNFFSHHSWIFVIELAGNWSPTYNLLSLSCCSMCSLHWDLVSRHVLRKNKHRDGCRYQLWRHHYVLLRYKIILEDVFFSAGHNFLNQESHQRSLQRMER